MLKKLRLQRFKNFEDVEISLGPITLLIGANASGKSNIREAFRFLHGVSRGYTVAEILGEKWIEGGALQWRGIRGGTREAAWRGAETFAITATFDLEYEGATCDAEYHIEVAPGDARTAPRVVSEHLIIPDLPGPGYTSVHDAMSGDDLFRSEIQVGPGFRASEISDLPGFLPGVKPSNHAITTTSALRMMPVLSQIADRSGNLRIQYRVEQNNGTRFGHGSSNQTLDPQVVSIARSAMVALSGMRFLDLSPEAMRIPSLPGQTVLGDRGENLSSVLHAICQDEQLKAALLEWVVQLTPMDAVDFEFPSDPAGRILVTLVEKNGQRISAYSASDGTLRFLAMIAALLGPEPAHFYFVEKIDNGIHPARLHLLLELLEQRTDTASIQIVGTTHSPQLLSLLRPRALEHASLVYRLPEATAANVRRIVDIPDARRLIEKQGRAELHATGWLEDAMFFTAPDEREELAG